MVTPFGLEALPRARRLRRQIEPTDERLIDVRKFGSAQAIQNEIAPTLIIQPPAEARISGGYRFNAEMYVRLAADGRGGLMELAPNQLHRLMLEARARDAHLVFDSLYLHTMLSDTMVGWLSERTGGSSLILHYLPSMDPGMSEESSAAIRTKEKRWLESVGAILVTGPRMEASARSVSPRLSSIAVTQPGVGADFRETRTKKTRGQGPLRMVSVGTVHPGKNQRMTLEALAATSIVKRTERTDGELPRANEFIWDVVGDLNAAPSYVQAFRERAERLGFNDRVRLWGAIPNSEVAILFDRADLYVSASRFESYGMATAEAVSHGLPVLGFAVGAAPDWIENGRNGWLYPPSEDERFSERILELIRRPEALVPHPDSAPHGFPTWSESYETLLGAISHPGARS